MKTIPIKHTDRFAVISDVHLRSPHDETTSLFIKTINSLQDIDALILLGDIFDFFSVTPFFLKMWADVLSTFENLKKRGIAVYFVEGNHDYGFEHTKDPTLINYFTKCGDMIIELEHTALGHIILRHGDDIVCPKSYLPFRRLVKSDLFQKIAVFFFRGFLLDFIFSRYAKHSRKKDKYRTMSADFLRSCLETYLQLCDPIPQVLVIGHIHCFVDQILNQTKILSGPDWFFAPNYLLVSKDGSLQRIFIGEKTCQPFVF